MTLRQTTWLKGVTRLVAIHDHVRSKGPQDQPASYGKPRRDSPSSAVTSLRSSLVGRFSIGITRAAPRRRFLHGLGLADEHNGPKFSSGELGVVAPEAAAHAARHRRACCPCSPSASPVRRPARRAARRPAGLGPATPARCCSWSRRTSCGA